MVAENTAVVEVKNELGQLAARLALILLDGGSTAVFAEAEMDQVLATVERQLLSTSTRVLTVAPPLDLSSLMRQLAPKSPKGSFPGAEALHAVLTETDLSCDRVVLLVRSAQELPFNTLRYLELALRAGPHLGVLLAGNWRLEETLALPGFSSLRARLVRHGLGAAGTAQPDDRDQRLVGAPSLRQLTGLIPSEPLAAAEIAKMGETVVAAHGSLPALAFAAKDLRLPANEPTASMNVSVWPETERPSTATRYRPTRHRVGSAVVCTVAAAAMLILLVVSRARQPFDPVQTPHSGATDRAAHSAPDVVVPDAASASGAISNPVEALRVEPDLRPTVLSTPDEQLAAATLPQPAAGSNEPAAELTLPVEDAARSPEPVGAREAVVPLDRAFTVPTRADHEIAPVGSDSIQDTGDTAASRPAGALDQPVPAPALPLRPGRPFVRPAPPARTTQYAALGARLAGPAAAHLASRPDSERCRDIVVRLQLGEDASNADRTFLRNGCH